MRFYQKKKSGSRLVKHSTLDKKQDLRALAEILGADERESKHGGHTCISIQFAHVPQVYTGKLSDLLSSHSPTGSQAWL